MKIVKVHIEGSTPYSSSKYIDVPKKPKESNPDFELRTWRERANYDPKTRLCYIPGISFVKMIHAAARHSPIQYQGKKNYTTFFERGLYAPHNLNLGIKVDDLESPDTGEWLMVPSDGKPGGGKRVKKCFPIFRDWKGIITIHVLDDTITPKQFEPTMTAGAAFIGIGRFRPEKCGWNGRFEITKFEWD